MRTIPLIEEDDGARRLLADNLRGSGCRAVALDEEDETLCLALNLTNESQPVSRSDACRY